MVFVCICWLAHYLFQTKHACSSIFPEMKNNFAWIDSFGSFYYANVLGEAGL